MRYPQRFVALAVALGWGLTAGAAEPAVLTLQGDTSRPDHSTFIQGEPVTLDFTVTGAGAGATDLRLRLDIVDEHERSIERRDVPMPAAAADGACRVSVSAPNPRLGFYRVRAALSNGVTLSKLGSRRAGFLTYAVVPDPAQRQLYPPEQTFFGMQGGFGKPPVKPLLGIRWVLGGYSWRDLEPKRAGEFAEARRQGTAKAREPLAGEENWTTYRLPCLYMAPAWAVEPATSSYCTGTLTPDGEKAWREYCLEVGRAFAAEAPQTQERLYQITWEPVYPWGYKGTDEQLIRIYEIAYPALHEADPQARVLGPTGAGISRNDVAWNATLLRKGLARHLDGFCIHPYHALPPEREGLIDRTRELRTVIDQLAGKPLGLYGTEQGFPTKEDPAKDLVQAQGLLRENLIMMGEGYRLNFAFYIVDYPTEPGYGYYYNLTPTIAWGPDRMSPKPAAPAYAAQSFLLEGHRSAGAIEWLGPTAWGYAFERPDRVVLALWDYGDTPREVTLPVGREVVQVWDWMGNRREVAAPDGQVRLTLTPDPVYVTGVAPELWSAAAPKPLRLAAARLTTFAGARAMLAAKVAANQGKAVRGRLVLQVPSGVNVVAKPHALSLRSGRSEQVELQLDIAAGTALGAYPATVRLEDESGACLAAAGLMLIVAEPVAVTALTSAEADAAGCAVNLRFCEEQGAAFRGEVEVRVAGLPLAQARAAVRLRSRQTRELRLLMPQADPVPGRVYTATVGLTAASGARYERTFPLGFMVAPAATSTPVIDADLADWSPQPAVKLEGRSWLVRSPEAYTGTNDSAAEIRCGWDRQAFYLACTVRDDAFVQEQTGFMTWKGDCLQLAFDLDPDRRGEGTGNLLAEKAQPRRVSEIDLALTRAGPEAFRTLTFDPERYPVAALAPEALRLEVVRTGTTVVYEAAIPWSTLGAERPPAVGSTIGFALTVNDLDEATQADPSALGLFGGIAGKKDPERFGRILLAADSARRPAGATARPALQFSGILGQSQPPEAEPLPFLTCTGVAFDASGQLWTVVGDRAFALAEPTPGRRRLARTVPLPTSALAQGVCSDGERLFIACGDGTVYSLDPASETVAPFCAWPEGAKSFTVTPAGVSGSFAAKAKLFVVADAAVHGVDASGRALGVLLALARPADASWWYCAVGIEPVSGDLLVGSYWPDSKVYRFGAGGQAVTVDGWPRNGHAQILTELGGQAWILAAGGSATPLPPVRRGPADDLPGLPAAWTWYHSGLAAAPAGGWWLASSQGLVGYSPDRAPRSMRLGGLPGVSLLAVAPDGTVIAAVENGQRLVRLGLADDPDTALRSDANEPWRTGNGWTGHACGLAWNGDRFLVLDRVGKQLWQFDPGHTAWGEKPWVALTEHNSFATPRLLAAGEGVVWVIDGSRLLELPRADLAAAREVPLPEGVAAADLVAIASSRDDLLFVALPTRILALERRPEGAYSVRWDRPQGLSGIRGLATLDDGLAVGGGGDGELAVLHAADGSLAGRLGATDVPGGMTPGCLAASDRWIVAADEAHARLLRFGVSR